MGGFAGLEDVPEDEVREGLDEVEPKTEEAAEGQEPAEEKEPEEGESEDEEEAPSKGKGYDKRIAELTGKMATLSKQRDRSQADFKRMQDLIAQRDARLAELERRLNEPEVPEPGEDDDPEAHIAFLKQKVKKVQEDGDRKVERARLDNLEAIQRAVHPDFDELKDRWESTFMADQGMLAKLRAASDPMAEFYKLAKKAQAAEDAEYVVEEDLGRARSVVAGTAPRRSDPEPREGGTAGISNEDWKQIQRIFPGRYKTREDYAKDAARLDDHNERSLWK